MFDIEDKVEEAWITPPEGFKEHTHGHGEDNEESDDNVHFGKECIDKILAFVGQAKCLPLLSIVLNNAMAPGADWR